MIGGFNTNVSYQGRTFHVQTEDSGHANPKIVTLLYEGGTILTSKKSNYEDKVSAENLESVVKELMEQQHSAMLQALKDGKLDEVVAKKKGKGGGVASGVANGADAQAPPFGKGVVTDRPLDEVVITHLCS